MAGPGGSTRSGSSGIIDTNMLSKKSPMHKLARLARLAGTTIGRDAVNSPGIDSFESLKALPISLKLIFPNEETCLKNKNKQFK